jgi:hypothetical protein
MKMNINQFVVEYLERFVSQGAKAVDAALLKTEGQPGYIIGIPLDNGPSIALTLTDYDRYSIALHHMEVTQRSTQTVEDLATYATGVVKRLTYLEEPLAITEIDNEKQVAQIRSQPPRQSGETLTYWEGLVTINPAPQIRLARYQWTPTHPERKVLTYPTTFNAVGRLAADLALSLMDNNT